MHGVVLDFYNFRQRMSQILQILFVISLGILTFSTFIVFNGEELPYIFYLLNSFSILFVLINIYSGTFG